jgi:hypothetical protein
LIDSWRAGHPYLRRPRIIGMTRWQISRLRRVRLTAMRLRSAAGAQGGAASSALKVFTRITLRFIRATKKSSYGRTIAASVFMSSGTPI